MYVYIMTFSKHMKRSFDGIRYKHLENLYEEEYNNLDTFHKEKISRNVIGNFFVNISCYYLMHQRILKRNITIF